MKTHYRLERENESLQALLYMAHLELEKMNDVKRDRDRLESLCRVQAEKLERIREML